MGMPVSLVVYKSVHHQNTAQLAQALADVLHADLLTPDMVGVTASEQRGSNPGQKQIQINPDRLRRYELIGFGSGVYYGRMHRDLLLAAKNIASNVVNSERHPPAAFVFSTSGLSLFSSIWHSPLKNLFTRHAIPIVGEFACRGFDSWGPLWLLGGLNQNHPDAQDLERGRRFARQLLHNWSSGRRCRAA